LHIQTEGLRAPQWQQTATRRPAPDPKPNSLTRTMSMQPISPFYFDFDKDDIEQFQQESAKILSSGVLILGEYTKRFEEDFASFVGSKYAISCNSGSVALEFLLRIKDVRGKKVLCPTNTNFATIAAIMRAGGEVIYLDMTKETFAPSLQMVQDAVEKHGDSVAG